MGELTGKPSPATSPPVSELESPKLKMTGGFLHGEAAEPGREQRITEETKKKKKKEMMLEKREEKRR